MTPLCKCSHTRDLHPGDGECIRPCGCQEFRLDPRSLIAGDLDAASEGAA